MPDLPVSPTFFLQVTQRFFFFLASLSPSLSSSRLLGPAQSALSFGSDFCGKISFVSDCKEDFQSRRPVTFNKLDLRESFEAVELRRRKLTTNDTRLATLSSSQTLGLFDMAFTKDFERCFKRKCRRVRCQRSPR